MICKRPVKPLISKSPIAAAFSPMVQVSEETVAPKAAPVEVTNEVPLKFNA